MCPKDSITSEQGKAYFAKAKTPVAIDTKDTFATYFDMRYNSRSEKKRKRKPMPKTFDSPNFKPNFAKPNFAFGLNHEKTLNTSSGFKQPP